MWTTQVTKTDQEDVVNASATHTADGVSFSCSSTIRIDGFAEFVAVAKAALGEHLLKLAAEATLKTELEALLNK